MGTLLTRWRLAIWAPGAGRPAVHGPDCCSRNATRPNSAASGQQDANATRMRLAVSTMRPATFRRWRQRRRSLPTRDSGLRTQIRTRFGQPPAGELESGIGPQPVEIVTVGIAAGNRQHACSEHILDCVGDMRRVARTVDQSGERSAIARRRSASESKITPLSEERMAAIECACDFLAARRLARRK